MQRKALLHNFCNIHYMAYFWIQQQLVAEAECQTLVFHSVDLSHETRLQSSRDGATRSSSQASAWQPFTNSVSSDLILQLWSLSDIWAWHSLFFFPCLPLRDTRDFKKSAYMIIEVDF